MKFMLLIFARQYPGLGPILFPPKHFALLEQKSHDLIDVGGVSKYVPYSH